jgi:serine/threonine-protein kinase
MLVGQSIGSASSGFYFHIEEELGCGAMGTVYRAQWELEGKPTRQVALKVVALGLLGNESAMARFEREANILKQLRHPHIVKLLATGNHRKAPFIVMEFIEGEPLDRALARKGRLSWEEVAVYGKQLCSALQYAHEKGIIHRDLKPSNLMINREGILKLTDFGIAKDTDVTALTGQNSTIGTASYMSPEQCKGDKNLTYKSDLYSLGVVFFELLSGKKPFVAENTVDMFLKHVNEKPPRIGRLVNDLPPKFEALIMQLMEKDKDDRPVDAAWVVRLLTEIEEDAVARKSAGLDAVTSKRNSKHRNLDGSRLDESDKDAARALRGRKKKKKKASAFFERKWVQAAGLLLALGALVVGGYLALRPPSAQKLSAAIDAAATPEDRVEAAAKYLEQYGDKPGELTDKAAAVYREGKTREREKQLTNRFAKNMSKPDETDDPDAYSLTWKAMEAEKAGSLNLAAEYWNKVKNRFPEEAKLPFALKDDVLARARWGWLADKRLGDIMKVTTLEAALKDKIVEHRKFEVPYANDPTSLDSQAVKGFRLEEFGDREKAVRVCWDPIAAEAEKDFAKRDYYLLACKQRASAPKAADDSVAARLGLITKALGTANALAEKVKADPEQKVERAEVRETCRTVVDLYGDESAQPIVDQIKRAKEIMAKVPRT